MTEFLVNNRDNSPIFISNSCFHGNGVYAATSFGCHDEIYQEHPWHFLQTLPNRQSVLVCGNCTKFLGSVGLQLRYLQKSISRNDIMLGSLGEFPQFEKLSDICPCAACCGELYCSEICRDSHWSQRGHRFLCTGHIAEEDAMVHPLVQFKMFCVESNEIFLMVADIIAQMICYAENMGSESSVPEKVAQACSQYESYVRNIWWDAIKAPKGQIPSKFRKTLQDLVKKAWNHFKSVFSLQERGLASIFNEEWIARTIGMFEQNNVGVRVENPIVSYIKKLEIESVEWSTLFDEIEQIRAYEEDDCCEDEIDLEQIDQEITNAEAANEEIPQADDGSSMEVDGSMGANERVLNLISDVGEDNFFPPLDGTAFYHVTCKINHSCVPNARVTYTCDTEKGLTLHMVSLANISKGEELFQSYIDQNMPVLDRSLALADYGFKCQCQKCLSGI